MTASIVMIKPMIRPTLVLPDFSFGAAGAAGTAVGAGAGAGSAVFVSVGFCSRTEASLFLP